MVHTTLKIFQREYLYRANSTALFLFEMKIQRTHFLEGPGHYLSVITLCLPLKDQPPFQLSGSLERIFHGLGNGPADQRDRPRGQAGLQTRRPVPAPLRPGARADPTLTFRSSPPSWANTSKSHAHRGRGPWGEARMPGPRPATLLAYYKCNICSVEKRIQWCRILRKKI